MGTPTQSAGTPDSADSPDPPDSTGHGSKNGATPAFATTRWSLVASAGLSDQDPARRDALSRLCESYWYPIYAFARRKGHDREDARDLVQGFFARFIEKHDIAKADAERGRFRTFLLACFEHYATNEWKKQTAQKRGGGAIQVSLDAAQGEDRWLLEPMGSDDPEREFHRTWARTLLEEVMRRLRAEYEHGGKGDVYERLRPVLSGDVEATDYRTIAESIGATEGAVRVAAHRLRKRFGEILRLEIAHTVRDGADVEDEIRGLFQALEPGD